MEMLRRLRTSTKSLWERSILSKRHPIEQLQEGRLPTLFRKCRLQDNRKVAEVPLQKQSTRSPTIHKSLYTMWWGPQTLGAKACTSQQRHMEANRAWKIGLITLRDNPKTLGNTQMRLLNLIEYPIWTFPEQLLIAITWISLWMLARLFINKLLWLDHFWKKVILITASNTNQSFLKFVRVTALPQSIVIKKGKWQFFLTKMTVRLCFRV